MRYVPRSLRALALAAALLTTLTAARPAAAQTKLLRFPDIHGDRVVFTYAGDLWTAPATGGSAVRLTAHPGLELFAKFSPDGRWIAFTGQYDGDEQVYVIPAAGGVPRQLTFYPARGPLPPRWGWDNQVTGWTHDSASVLFRSMRDGWDLADTRLYTVPRTGGLAQPLPMPVSGAGDFSPDGRKVVYSPIARDFRTWKRYQGGWAQDLWIFDLASHEAVNITNHPRTDRDPMWTGGKIFFSSDRTGTLNLYSYDPESGETAQLTRSTAGDVRWPSADGEGRIVYELDGELSVLDTRNGGEGEKIAVHVPDDGLHSRPARVSAADKLEDAALSPKGERVLVVARGEVFSLPVEKGVARNLSRTAGAHEKWARWSPDGRKVAFFSDRDGEEELYLIDPDGSGPPERLTEGGQAMRYAPAWAPDGKRLAFSDKDGKLWVHTLAGRKLTEVADDEYGFVRDYAWSPCGGHLAFSLREATGLRSLWVWSAGDGRLRRVTDGSFSESRPAWDPKGRYLYYVSNRGYAVQFDAFDFNWAQDRNDGLFALALRRDVAHPFPPEEDPVTVDGEGEEQEEGEAGQDGKETGKETEKKAKTEKPAEDEKAEGRGPDGFLRIDWDGLAARVARVPVPLGNYDSLVAAEGRLLYGRGPAFVMGGEPAGTPALHVFDLEKREESQLAENVGGFTVSEDGSKVLVLERGELNLYDAKPGGKDSKKTISKAGLMVDRVPAEEWPAIFDEVWRRYRDFFYVENMHGYDWQAIRERYRPLLAHVAHRADLNYVIGEMIAELNVSHAYVAGGDYGLPERPRVALPGARFELDPAAGRYRLARRFRGHNEEDRYRSPLTEVGVDARVGDYLLAVDGEELRAEDNPYRLLRHKADRPVRLTLNDRPGFEGAREVTFRPVDSEQSLIYLEKIAANRERVDRLSNGRVGYLHLPDMGEDGLREFVKWLPGQLRKEGLVIDVRDNGGGFVSQTLLERLGRRPLSVDFGRLSDHPGPYPALAFHGHMATVINEGSASDGDIFPAMFRQMGLGPLIGKRTWGGVVGISGHGPLLDGGSISVPEAGSASAETGDWIIEGYGVDPDIVVENDAKSVIAGRDPQLERAVAEVLKKIEAEPRKLPKKPADPVRTQ
jgi:tricorn protease